MILNSRNKQKLRMFFAIVSICTYAPEKALSQPLKFFTKQIPESISVRQGQKISIDRIFSKEPATISWKLSNKSICQNKKACTIDTQKINMGIHSLKITALSSDDTVSHYEEISAEIVIASRYPANEKTWQDIIVIETIPLESKSRVIQLSTPIPTPYFYRPTQNPIKINTRQWLQTDSEFNGYINMGKDTEIFLLKKSRIQNTSQNMLNHWITDHGEMRLRDFSSDSAGYIKTILVPKENQKSSIDKKFVGYKIHWKGAVDFIVSYIPPNENIFYFHELLSHKNPLGSINVTVLRGKVSISFRSHDRIIEPGYKFSYNGEQNKHLSKKFTLDSPEEIFLSSDKNTEITTANTSSTNKWLKMTTPESSFDSLGEKNLNDYFKTKQSHPMAAFQPKRTFKIKQPAKSIQQILSAQNTPQNKSFDNYWCIESLMQFSKTKINKQAEKYHSILGDCFRRISLKKEAIAAYRSALAYPKSQLNNTLKLAQTLLIDANKTSAKSALDLLDNGIDPIQTDRRIPVPVLSSMSASQKKTYFDIKRTCYEITDNSAALENNERIFTSTDTSTLRKHVIETNLLSSNWDKNAFQYHTLSSQISTHTNLWKLDVSGSPSGLNKSWRSGVLKTQSVFNLKNRTQKEKQQHNHQKKDWFFGRVRIDTHAVYHHQSPLVSPLESKVNLELQMGLRALNGKQIPWIHLEFSPNLEVSNFEGRKIWYAHGFNMRAQKNDLWGSPYINLQYTKKLDPIVGDTHSVDQSSFQEAQDRSPLKFDPNNPDAEATRILQEGQFAASSDRSNELFRGALSLHLPVLDEKSNLYWFSNFDYSMQTYIQQESKKDSHKIIMLNNVLYYKPSNIYDGWIQISAGRLLRSEIYGVLEIKSIANWYFKPNWWAGIEARKAQQGNASSTQVSAFINYSTSIWTIPSFFKN